MTDDTSSTNERTDTTRAGATGPADGAIVEALAEHAITLETVDPAADFDDLEPLRDAFADARVVGLGEATHGTREFFRLKYRLLRYLVAELDVRALGLEANFPPVLAINDYVVHGDGDPEEAIEGLRIWPWKVESVLAMVRWLREFNADRPADDRVRFYGIDARYSQGAIDALVAFFETADEELPAGVRDDLDAAADAGVPPHQADSLETCFEAAERVVPALRDRLQENRDSYVAATSERTWELARQHVRVVEQAAEYQRALHDRREGTVEEKTAVERCLQVRDRSMADNVEWILEFEDPDRMAVWGHDAHVNRVETATRRTDAAATSLGGHLDARHGDDYYALGFSFGRGSFQAITEISDAQSDEETYALREQTVGGPSPGTIDAALAALDRSPAVVDVRSAADDGGTDDGSTDGSAGDDGAPDHGVAEWLAQPRRHRSIGATFDPENREQYVVEYTYADAFDAVAYVEETTRARPLESVLED